MKALLLHTIIFCGIILLGTVTAQDGKIIIPQNAVPVDRDGVILVFNTNQPAEILVINKNGEWVSDARKVTIVADLVNKTPVEVECVMWKGLFKPANPRTEKWGLSGVISASKEEFNKILQDLQNDRFSLN